ncbi:MAG: IS66 family transposase [Syntrophobacterales bacterium]|nr:MAG: IS66 family transposase [Syntrophobacterales bacterium]
MSARDTNKQNRNTGEFHVDEQELQALAQRVADRKIEDTDWSILHRYLLLFLKLSQVFQYGRIRMRKISRMLFGKRTEKEKKKKEKDPPGNPPQSVAGGETPPGPEKESKPDDAQLDQDRKKGKGHGRRAADAYQNAETIHCPICHNKAGELCPACQQGRLRQMPEEIVVRFTGSPTVTALKYGRERVRCDTCGQIYKAELPEKAGDEKYDASAKASIVMSKYGSGVPFYRLGMQQEQQLVPLPPSTQWQLVEESADSILPVYLELERHVARAELIFIDDTPNLVLESGKKEHTTGVVAKTGERWVTLYLTGTDQAGKKISVLLEARPPGLPPPLQMSDALAGNQQDVILVLISLCMVHARRHFFEIKEFYPEVCNPVLEAIRQVFKHEREIKNLQLNAAARLVYHQEHSQPLLERMKGWLLNQMDQQLIEPNSPLGKAVKYLKKHWDGLMGFCRHEGAPLDNNPVERALKLPIQNRKNAYFFKTSHGADVGCLLMSMIKTASQAGTSPFAYLQALLQHRSVLRQDPGLWLPWNYRAQLSA